MKKIKVQVSVVLVTLASIVSVSALEYFDWCGSTTTVTSTACVEFGAGAGCRNEGAACETTTTVYACSAALAVCSPSSCNRTVGPTVAATCNTVQEEPSGESWYNCDCK